MSLFDIIMTVIVLGVMAGIAFLAFSFLSMLMPILDKICNFITWPLRKLGQLLRSLTAPALDFFRSLTGHHSLESFGGPGVLFFFLAALTFSVIYALLLVNGGESQNILELILYNTPMGAFILLIQNGFDFSVDPAALVAAGFSGFLATACMNRVSDLKWYVWAPYCLVFIAFSAIVASFCAGFFEAVGSWGITTITALSDATVGSGISLVFTYIALIVLGYLAIVLFSLVVREYYACLCFGPISLAVFVIVGGIFEKLVRPEQYEGPGYHWSEYVLLLLLLSVLVLVEFIRDQYDKKMSLSA